MNKKRILGTGLIISVVGFVLYYLDKLLKNAEAKSTAISTASTSTSTTPNVYVQLTGINSGEYTNSGNGIALYFDIPHTLGVVPTSAVVTAVSEDAQGFSYITKTATYIRIFYAVAPPEGVNNLVFNYSISR